MTAIPALTMMTSTSGQSPTTLLPTYSYSDVQPHEQRAQNTLGEAIYYLQNVKAK
jgi:hypothetical protein